MFISKSKALSRSWLLILLFNMVPAIILADGQSVFKSNRDKVIIIRTLFNGRMIGNGTAFLARYGAKNYVITNFHVISSGNFVMERTGEKIPGFQVLSANEKEDIAILTFSGIDDLNGIPLLAYEPGEGEEVYALGYPGIDSTRDRALTITNGLVSNSKLLLTLNGSQEKRYIQISASINPGNSGGPVFGKSGQLIGMATLKWLNLSSVGAAIPANDIIGEIEKIQTPPASHGEAKKLLTMKLHDLTRSMKTSDVMNYGTYFAPHVRASSYRQVLFTADRVQKAVGLAGIMHSGEKDNYISFLSDILSEEEFIYYMVMQSYFKSNPQKSIGNVIANPYLASRLYLSSQFLYLFKRISQVPYKDLKFKSYAIQDIQFSDDYRIANCKLRIILEDSQFDLKLKFIYEWNHYFLALLD